MTAVEAQERRFDFLIQEQWEAPFFGVDHCSFKLGEQVFEAVEDENDGYRSCLGSVEVRDVAGKVFFKTPLDVVRLSRSSESAVPNDFSGELDFFRLTSIVDGHVWLEFGTSNSDDYYPCFVFHYRPRVATP